MPPPREKSAGSAKSSWHGLPGRFCRQTRGPVDGATPRDPHVRPLVPQCRPPRGGGILPPRNIRAQDAATQFPGARSPPRNSRTRDAPAQSARAQDTPRDLRGGETPPPREKSAGSAKSSWHGLPGRFCRQTRGPVDGATPRDPHVRPPVPQCRPPRGGGILPPRNIRAQDAATQFPGARSPPRNSRTRDAPARSARGRDAPATGKIRGVCKIFVARPTRPFLPADPRSHRRRDAARSTRSSSRPEVPSAPWRGHPASAQHPGARCPRATPGREMPPRNLRRGETPSPRKSLPARPACRVVVQASPPIIPSLHRSPGRRRTRAAAAGTAPRPAARPPRCPPSPRRCGVGTSRSTPCWPGPAAS